jgi:hypothetical protein
VRSNLRRRVIWFTIGVITSYFFTYTLLDFEVEECHQSDEQPVSRSYMELRAEHPLNIWERVCVDGENWDSVRRGCY